MPKHQNENSGQGATSVDGALFDIFESARLRGGGCSSETLRVGQPLLFPKARPCLHFIEAGACVLRVSGSRQALALQPGDLVVMPKGGPHMLEHSGEKLAHITTCDFRFDGPGGSLLTSALPRIMHVVNAAEPPVAFPDTPRDWLSVTLAAIRLEANNPWLGSSVMQSRLIDLLFVWSLRHWLVTASPQVGNVARALGDDVVGRALGLLHAHPAKDWSVNTLARELNLSRSTLAQRFAETLGQPPMRYLTGWRMQLAADFLVSTKQRVSQIAQRVGYDSEPSFSRAFKRQFGASPTEYRSAQSP